LKKYGFSVGPFHGKDGSAIDLDLGVAANVT
jgi:hypothetical protein